MGRSPGCLWTLLHTEEDPLSLREAESFHRSPSQALKPQRPGDKSILATARERGRSWGRVA